MTAKHPPSHRVGAFAIIRDDQGRVLLSRRADSGWWNLPGGGVEPHETVTEGVVREVREETGLEVVAGRLIGVYSKPQKHEIVLTFECKIVGGTMVASDEADLNEWFAPDALPTEQFLPKHRERVLDALSEEAGAIVRDQRQPSVAAGNVGGM
ncbi:MAG TPA: NUDIX domain-containing protein [Herpetosiphonaceae bacterium]